MVNKRFWLGILAMVLIFGMTVVGCDGILDSETSPLDGTWISTTPINDDGYYCKLIADNGSFTQSIAPSKTATTWTDVIKGTYTQNAQGSMTVTFTSVNTLMFGGENVWKKWADLDSEIKKDLPETVPMTISGNQFTANDLTFERTSVSGDDSDPDTDPTTSDIDGTWISTTPINDDGYYCRLIADNGSFTQSIAPSKTETTWTDVIKGTYTQNAQGSMTVTFTSVNTLMFGGENVWKVWADLDSEIKEDLPETVPMTISGNQFTANDLTFQRE